MKLNEKISELLNIPYISEDDVVDRHGCFTLTPLLSSGLVGDGAPAHEDDHIRVNVFYANQFTMMKKTKELRKELLKLHKVIVSDPSYTYEKEWKVWRAMMTVISIGGNDE